MGMKTEDISLYICESDQSTSLWADTCFLLHAQFPAFCAQLEQLRVQLHVPAQVLNEIPNVIKTQIHANPTEAAFHSSVYRMVQDDGIARGKIKLETMSGQSFPNGDAALLSAVITELDKSNLIVLTQDGKLAQALYSTLEVVKPVLLRPHKLLVMGHRRDGGLLIHQPGTTALSPELEALSPYWVGFDVKTGTPAAQAPVSIAAPAPGVRYMTQHEVVRIESLRNGRIFNTCTTNGTAGVCVIPPASTGMACKLAKLKELRERLALLESHPLILPEELLLDMSTRAIAGATIRLPAGFLPLRSYAPSIFKMPWESRCQIVSGLTQAVRFSNRLGLVHTALNPEYVFVNPITLDVRLCCCTSEIQIESIAGCTFYGNPLTANAPQGQLMPTTAITPALTKLILQLLTGGGAPEMDLDLLPLSDESRETLRSALSNTTPMSARMLYRAVTRGSQKQSSPSRPVENSGMCANPSCANAGRIVPLAKDSIYCTACNSMVSETRICREDNKPFNITLGEAYFYQKKGFALPTRCPSCRKNRAGGNAEPPRVSFPRPLNVL